MINLRIINGDTSYEPVVTGEVKLSTERFGSPGKLTFEVVKDEKLNFQEGNAVQLRIDGMDLFLGYVFEKKRTKSESISVTAYDQLRYFKNKDVKQFEYMTAGQIVKKLATDFLLTTGGIADTGWVIESLIEDNKTIFDMVQDALDETLTNAKALYVLYDDFGKLTLKNVEDMKLNILLTDETAEDFDYTTSIDSQTYNNIKLVYDNEDTGYWDVYEAKSGDSINKWGLLQYLEKVSTTTGIKNKADTLLSMYNRKTRRLSLKNAFGDVNVRAGCSLGVSLALGDTTVNQYFICETVTHSFKAGMHLMDITLRGGDFIV